MHYEDGTWRGLRLKLFGRRLLDPWCIVFGADEHRYRLNPRISIEQVRDFENTHSVSLPSDYRRFLLEAGNGGAGPAYGLYPLEETPFYGDLAKPFGLTEEWEMPANTPVEYRVPDEYYDGCLAISELGDGYQSLLVITGPAAGTIWEDYTCADSGIYPTGLNFKTWYRKWLRFLG